MDKETCKHGSVLSLSLDGVRGASPAHQDSTKIAWPLENPRGDQQDEDRQMQKGPTIGINYGSGDT